jgi:hypothetical protein
MTQEIDHSPYEVARRLDKAMELLVIQDRLNTQATEALEILADVQQKILARLEILEKSANTLHLKRTPRNE